MCNYTFIITVIPSLLFPHYYRCAHNMTTNHTNVTPAIIMINKNNENDSNNLKKLFKTHKTVTVLAIFLWMEERGASWANT